jgi:perosamine synthetase
MPALTFVAPANAVRYLNAWPVFIDVEPDYWQIDPVKLADFLEKECRSVDGGVLNRTTGRRIRAVLPVDLLGHPADMRPIVEVARRRGLAIVEDATESLGARYYGEAVGRLSDIACFSFNGNKIVTSGGGGMIVTDNHQWAARARSLTTQAKSDPIESIHAEVGFNYRLTNLQAALGVAQLEQLNVYVEAKRGVAARYRGAFADVPGLSMMREAPWARATFWMSTVLVSEREYGRSSRDVLAALERQAIEARPLWQPLHLSPAHQGRQAYHCHVSERLYRDAVSIPSSVGLSPEDQQRVISVMCHRQATTSWSGR